MTIGTFRRNVVKTLRPKATKTAMRLVSKNTTRTQAAQGAVALKGHTGQLLQVTAQYLLGAQQTQEMKDQASLVLGDVGFDLALLGRVLKVKLPAATKRSKLSGTRGAALLQLDSLATDMLRQVEQGLFMPSPMTTVTKMVTMPQKGGIKEERQVEVVDHAIVQTDEVERQGHMRSFLTGAIDVYWRLCYDLTGTPPEAVLQAKMQRMPKEYPSVTFDTGEKKPVKAAVAVKGKPVAKAKAKAKKTPAEPVPA